MIFLMEVSSCVPRERQGERTLGAIGPATHMVAHERDFNFGATHRALDGRQRGALPRHGRHCCGAVGRSFGWVVLMTMCISRRRRPAQFGFESSSSSILVLLAFSPCLFETL